VDRQNVMISRTKEKGRTHEPFTKKKRGGKGKEEKKNPADRARAEKGANRVKLPLRALLNEKGTYHRGKRFQVFKEGKKGEGGPRSTVCGPARSEKTGPGMSLIFCLPDTLEAGNTGGSRGKEGKGRFPSKEEGRKKEGDPALITLTKGLKKKMWN